MSIYLETDKEASLLIDASISDQVGQPLPANYTAPHASAPAALNVDIMHEGVVIGNKLVEIGATDVEVPIDLNQFTSGLGGLNITVRTRAGRDDLYETSTELFKLPVPTDYGSVSRLDNLYGGLWVQRDGEDWHHIFPYTYYGKSV